MSNSERIVKGILGTKLGMTQLWDENNKVVPVTVIQAGPCVVTQVRTPEKDGYSAVQLGFGAIASRKVTKPAQGHFDKAGVTIPTVNKPWTKDEFMGALDKLSKLDGFSYAIDMSVWDTAEWWPYAYAPMLQSFGGDLIDRKSYETAEGFLNGDKAVEWGTWFRSLFTSNYASQTPAKDGQDFLQGKVPLVYAGGWKVLKAQETFGKDEVLILPPVDFGAGAHVGGGSWQWGVSSSSKNADAANKFIEFLMQDKYLVQYSDAIGNFPSIESATPKTKYYGEGKPLEPVYEIGKKYALLRPATPGYKVISSTFDKAARDIVSGSDVKSTLDQAVKDINADIKSNDGYKAK